MEADDMTGMEFRAVLMAVLAFLQQGEPERAVAYYDLLKLGYNTGISG